MMKAKRQAAGATRENFVSREINWNLTFCRGAAENCSQLLRSNAEIIKLQARCNEYVWLSISDGKYRFDSRHPSNNIFQAGNLR